MFKSAKKSLIIVTIAAMVLLPLCNPALSAEYFETENPSGGAMMFDLAVVRPISFVATAIGCVCFVVSSPFAALGGNLDLAGEKLVKSPAAFTFKRPLGDFN